MLPPFPSHKATWRVFSGCPKCGEEEPEIKWFGNNSFACLYASDGHYREHFHVTCRRCGCMWVEPVELVH